MTLDEPCLDLAETLAEAQVALLGIEAEELELTLRLRDVELTRHGGQDGAERLVRRLGEDHAPWDDEQPARLFGDDRRSRCSSAQEIGERACEIARNVERARALRAVVEREHLAHDALSDERDVGCGVARVEENATGREPAHTKVSLQRKEVAVVERREPTETRAPPRDVLTVRSERLVGSGCGHAGRLATICIVALGPA